MKGLLTTSLKTTLSSTKKVVKSHSHLDLTKTSFLLFLLDIVDTKKSSQINKLIENRQNLTNSYYCYEIQSF